jgi:Arc/MetJ-type ribon-helix-helix transcriptional regulator
MTTITLPKDLEDWARAEVAAGRAASVEQAVTRGVRGYRRAMETFRQSLDDAEAEADRDGWIPGDAFMRELDGWIADLTQDVEREAAGEAAE